MNAKLQLSRNFSASGGQSCTLRNAFLLLVNLYIFLYIFIYMYVYFFNIYKKNIYTNIYMFFFSNIFFNFRFNIFNGIMFFLLFSKQLEWIPIGSVQIIYGNRNYFTFRVFPNYGYANTLPPRPPSVLIRFLWMMRNVLKHMKNQFYDISFEKIVKNSSKIGV